MSDFSNLFSIFVRKLDSPLKFESLYIMEPAQQTKTQRWISNIKFILVAGGGLFGDGYLNSNIGLGMLTFPLTRQTPCS
jgi:hypothetical protein